MDYSLALSKLQILLAIAAIIFASRGKLRPVAILASFITFAFALEFFLPDGNLSTEQALEAIWYSLVCAAPFAMCIDPRFSELLKRVGEHDEVN